MDKESHISIFVKEMRVNLRIGLYAHEKEGPQPIDVSIELFAEASYLSGVDQAKIIDYSAVHKAIKEWEGREHVDLMETYLQELLDIAFCFDQVTAVRASISKPTIFDDVESAGLSAFMRREDYKA